MPRLLRSALLSFAVLVVAPDVVLSQAAVPDAPAPAKKRRSDNMRITQEDLEGIQGNFVTAVDMIRTLRPRWLNPTMGRMAQAGGDGMPGGGATEIVIYIDGNRQPSMNELNTLRAALVREMRYLDQNKAVQNYGPGHEMGVIEVTTNGNPR